MQQIERVGVVALLFLVVTIITVAMWDDGTSTDTVQAAQLEDTRTDRNTRRDARSVPREGNDRVRTTRARGQL